MMLIKVKGTKFRKIFANLNKFYIKRAKQTFSHLSPLSEKLCLSRKLSGRKISGKYQGFCLGSWNKQKGEQAVFVLILAFTL